MDIDLPLIGYNVIEDYIKNGLTGHEMMNVFPKISPANVNCLVELICNEDVNVCFVKTDKQNHTIKKGQTLQIPCRLHHGPISTTTPVLFKPEEPA